MTSATSDAPLVSVVVAVYDIAPYVRQCLESIAGQTYGNLQVLVVDDGSTDGGGEVCDEFSRSFPDRFAVIHTANGGLSAARNRGIERARGEWLLFVDGDDWLEPDTVEALAAEVLRTGADIVACRHLREWRDRTEPPVGEAIGAVYEGAEALRAYVCGGIDVSAWGKLYKAELFRDLRFPEGQVYEDVRTVWKAYAAARRVACLPDALCHYRVRHGSIVNTNTARNIADLWGAYKGRYDALAPLSPEFEAAELARCASIACSMWRRHDDIAAGERPLAQGVYDDAADFVRERYRDALHGSIGADVKLTLPLARHATPASFAAAHALYRLYSLVRRKRPEGMFE